MPRTECPLEAAIKKVVLEYEIDPEKVGPASFEMICSQCGDLVSATVGRERPGGEIKKLEDSCQRKNSAKKTEKRRRNSNLSSNVNQPHVSILSRLWINLIFGHKPIWINPSKGPVADPTNWYGKMKIQEAISWEEHDILRNGGKRG